jgi:hypothetical protein
MTLLNKCQPTAAYRQEMRERREQRATAVLAEMAQRERARRVRYNAAMAAMAALPAEKRAAVIAKAKRKAAGERGGSVFTDDAILCIDRMKLAGAKSADIAEAIGTTVGSLRARCSQLGIKLKPKRNAIAA